MSKSPNNGSARSDGESRRGPALSLEEGWRWFLALIAHKDRTALRHHKQTVLRYQAVVQKFIRFAREHGVTTWNAVNGPLVESYLRLLLDQRRTPSTLYLEAACLKAIVNRLIRSGMLPRSCRLVVNVPRQIPPRPAA